MRTVASSVLTTLIALLLCFSTPVFGYDFSEVGKVLKRDLSLFPEKKDPAKIAVVYGHSDREAIKQHYNLARLKKELTHELLTHFQVADPIVTVQILDKNLLELEDLSSDTSVLTQFADRADSNHVLLVQLSLEGTTLNADMRLLNQFSQEISTVSLQLTPESEPVIQEKTETVTTSQPVEREEEPEEKSSGFSFLSSYNAPEFDESQNDSWVYFTPTALTNQRKNYLQVSLWLNNLGDVDIPPVQLRYEHTFLQVVQVGIESNGTEEKGPHSTYAFAKYRVIEAASTTFSLGMKGRLLWNDDNTEFKQGSEDTNDKNDKRNKLTLFAAATAKVEFLGLLLNGYVDNQTFSLGTKLLVTSNIKLIADSIYYYYDEAPRKGDQAIGIQLFNSMGLSTTLSYQVETEQKRLAIGFNW